MTPFVRSFPLLLALWCVLAGCASSGTSAVSRYANLPIPGFDSLRAFRYLQQQVAFGPRVPGTEAHDRTVEWLVGTLRPLSDTVFVQSFSQPISRLGSLTLRNVIARFRSGHAPRLMLSAHVDTRPWADQDPDPAHQQVPVPGANDGASGVAVLLELAQRFHELPPPIGVDIVLFDGEDLGTPGRGDDWCLGSRYFSRHLPTGPVIAGGINVDMIGSRGLVVRREGYSDSRARALVEQVFAAAADAGVASFRNEPGITILDDHVPLNDAGVPAIDLIDFGNGDVSDRTWHTVSDVPDSCSAASLGSVGAVLLGFVYHYGPVWENEQ